MRASGAEQCAVLAVGLLWGATNPLVEAGAKLVKERLDSLPHSPSWFQSLRIHCVTVPFILPHLLNTVGSLLFIYLLSLSSVNIGFVVPAANAAALAITGLITFSKLTAQHLRTPAAKAQLLLGLALVSAGILLCSWS